MLAPKYHDPHINYGLDPVRERYLVRVPDSYAGNVPYGLVVFIDADEVINDVPDGWASVLDARQLLFVSPENGGNDQDRDRRMGLAVLGALGDDEALSNRPQPSVRCWIFWRSSHGRNVGFYQPDVFRGTIQNCGADFYRQVPTVHATSWVSTSGRPYGTFQAIDEEIVKAEQVRFVLVTGTNDFRRGNILDIFSGGFAKEGF